MVHSIEQGTKPRKEDVDTQRALDALRKAGKIDEYWQLMGPGGNTPCLGIRYLWARLMPNQQIPTLAIDPDASDKTAPATAEVGQEINRSCKKLFRCR